MRRGSKRVTVLNDRGGGTSLLKVGTFEDLLTWLLAHTLRLVFEQTLKDLVLLSCGPFGGEGEIRCLCLLETLGVISVPEEELEVFSSELNVDEIVHEVANSARLTSQ